MVRLRVLHSPLDESLDLRLVEADRRLRGRDQGHDRLAGVAADNRDAANARALSAAAEEGHLRTGDAPVLERLLRGTVGLRDEGTGAHNVERGHTEEAEEWGCSVTRIGARTDQHSPLGVVDTLLLEHLSHNGHRRVDCSRGVSQELGSRSCCSHAPGFEMISTKALGACVAMPMAVSRTMLALI